MIDSIKLLLYICNIFFEILFIGCGIVLVVLNTKLSISILGGIMIGIGIISVIFIGGVSFMVIFNTCKTNQIDDDESFWH